MRAGLGAGPIGRHAFLEEVNRKRRISRQLAESSNRQLVPMSPRACAQVFFTHVHKLNSGTTKSSARERKTKKAIMLRGISGALALTVRGVARNVTTLSLDSNAWLQSERKKAPPLRVRPKVYVRGVENSP